MNLLIKYLQCCNVISCTALLWPVLYHPALQCTVLSCRVDTRGSSPPTRAAPPALLTILPLPNLAVSPRVDSRGPKSPLRSPLPKVSPYLASSPPNIDLYLGPNVSRAMVMRPSIQGVSYRFKFTDKKKHVCKVCNWRRVVGTFYPDL